MKILVAGSNGQLARCLVDQAALTSGVEVSALGRPQLDLEKLKGLGAIEDFAPDAIINAAAYTAVDAAETDPERAFAINRDGAGWLAHIAAQRRIPFLHVSSDFVFDGAKPTAYNEDDAPNPLNTYGRSKLEGEKAVQEACPTALIFRCSWIYSAYGQNFVKTMLRLARERDNLRVVDDQIGSPTSALDIAKAMLDVARRVAKERDRVGAIYHLAASGETTWFGFATEIMRLAAESGLRSVPVSPITTAEFPTPARRPANSRLDCQRVNRELGLSLPPWQGSLAATVKALAAAEHT